LEPIPAAEHPAAEDPGPAGLTAGDEGDHAREMANLVKVLQEKRAPKEVQPAMTRATPRLETNQNLLPYYPTALRKQRLEGVVQLRVWVSDQGRVDKLTVVGSSGHGLLDQAAVDAVRHWRFVPARLGEIAVADVIDVPVPFRLDK
jgi:protein TonB